MAALVAGICVGSLWVKLYSACSQLPSDAKQQLDKQEHQAHPGYGIGVQSTSRESA